MIPGRDKMIRARVQPCRVYYRKIACCQPNSARALNESRTPAWCSAAEQQKSTRAAALLSPVVCALRSRVLQILNLKLEPNDDVKCEPGVLMHSEFVFQNLLFSPREGSAACVYQGGGNDVALLIPLWVFLFCVLLLRLWLHAATPCLPAPALSSGAGHFAVHVVCVLDPAVVWRRGPVEDPLRERVQRRGHHRAHAEPSRQGEEKKERMGPQVRVRAPELSVLAFANCARDLLL
jgi:hypothetical protein